MLLLRHQLCRVRNRPAELEGDKKDLLVPERAQPALNGHSQHYTKSTADYLREQLQAKDAEIARLGEEVTVLKKPKRKARSRSKKSTV